MKKIQLQFSHFLSEEAYCNLQNEFLQCDIHYPQNMKVLDSPEEEIEILDVIYYKGESEPGNYLNFRKDFLEVEIPKMHYFYLNKINKEYYTSPIQNEEIRKTIAEKYISRFKSIEEKLSDNTIVPFLNKNTGDLLIEQINVIKLTLRNWIKNPYPNAKEKLSFRMKRIDVVTLFYVLKKRGIIKPILDADLAFIIESLCEYQDKSEYKPISGAAGQLSKIINGEHNIERSLKRLMLKFRANFFKNDFGL